MEHKWKENKTISIDKKGKIYIQYEDRKAEFDNIDEMIRFMDERMYTYTRIKNDIANLEITEEKTKVFRVNCWYKEYIEDFLVIVARNFKEARLLLRKCLIDNYERPNISDIREVLFKDEIDIAAFDVYRTQDIGVYLWGDHGVATNKNFSKIKYDKRKVTRTRLYKSAIFGFVIADAVGVQYEFKFRDSMRQNPCTDMIGFNRYKIDRGCWSSNSSLTLATLDSLSKGYNLLDIMQKYLAWHTQDEYTSTGSVFARDLTVDFALNDYIETNDLSKIGFPFPHCNKNGSLLRVLPLCMYLTFNEVEIVNAIKMIHDFSGLTDGYRLSKMSCGFYYFIVKEMITTRNTMEGYLQEAMNKAFEFYKYYRELKHFERLRNLEIFKDVDESHIKSGDNAIETLEASIWCLLQHSDYRESVLHAVNLGDDTDTTAAVTGGLAGLCYGYSDIPIRWTHAIKRKEYIKSLCETIGKS